MPADPALTTGLRSPVRPDRAAGRLARSPGLLAALAARLTARDRWLLRMLHEHRVLTTTQITWLAFGTTRAATARLLTLYQLRAIDNRVGHHPGSGRSGRYRGSSRCGASGRAGRSRGAHLSRRGQLTGPCCSPRRGARTSSESGPPGAAKTVATPACRPDITP